MKLAALALAALFCASPLAQAVPITDWRIDDLMMQAAEARKELGLNENQNLLWEQSVRKTRAVLRTRKERRELVDATARKAAVDPAAGLRQLAAPLDEDAALSQIEDRRLRETWLTLNDALDDRRSAADQRTDGRWSWSSRTAAGNSRLPPCSFLRSSAAGSA